MTTAQYKKQYTTILQYVLYVYMYICTNINIHIMHMTKTATYKNNKYVYIYMKPINHQKYTNTQLITKIQYI